MVEHPCSKCPILDLGHRYPVKDERDPWRRMPRMFEAARKILGPGMYQHESRARYNAELRLGHYCKVMREKHGPCNNSRIVTCHAALRGCFEAAAKARNPWPFAHAAITRLTTDDRHHDLIRQTRISEPIPGIKVPPISLQQLPEVS